tara:strand:+ start:3129 stop:3329 length:201 start_codon:yes stop_codon:yes gene_type:complete
MTTSSTSYHGVSKIKIKKEAKTEDYPYEYMYITVTSKSGDDNTIILFGEEDELDVELEGRYGNYAV